MVAVVAVVAVAGVARAGAAQAAAVKAGAEKRLVSAARVVEAPSAERSNKGVQSRNRRDSENEPQTFAGRSESGCDAMVTKDSKS